MRNSGAIISLQPRGLAYAIIELRDFRNLGVLPLAPHFVHGVDDERIGGHGNGGLIKGNGRIQIQELFQPKRRESY